MASQRFFFPKFTFHHVAHRLAAAMVIISVVLRLISYQLGSLHFVLQPAEVLAGQLWQPFTTLLIATDPMEIIFGAIIIYSCGMHLAQWWGDKRFLAVSLGIPFVAMILTVLLSLLLGPIARGFYAGAICVTTTIWISYGLLSHFSGGVMNFWGIPMTGLSFAYLGVGFVVLNGVFASFTAVVPALIASGLTFFYCFDRRGEQFLGRIELIYYNWKLKRLKAKRGLRVVQGEKGKKGDPDRHLH